MQIETTSNDCREILQQTAANLAKRAARNKAPEPEIDSEGQFIATVEGVRVHLKTCGDPADLAPEAYAARIFNFFDCTCEIYIIAMVYINRLLEKNPEFVVNAQAINRLLLTSVILALKWHEDISEQYPLSHYAIVGSVALGELRQLEASFVGLLGWDLHVDSMDYLSHGFVAVACKTRALLLNTVSNCSTRQGTPALDSDDEDTDSWSDDSDEECLPGRPLWGIQSFRRKEEGENKEKDEQEEAKEEEEGEEAEEDFLPGMPLWTVQSYRLQEEMAEAEMADTEDEECLPGWPLWNAEGYLAKAFMEGVEDEAEEVQEEEEGDDEDCSPGRPLWTVQSYITGMPLWNAESYLAKAFTEDVEHETEEVQEEEEGDDEDYLPGKPLWTIQSYETRAF